MNGQTRREGWRDWLLVGLAYLVVALLMTCPLILHFNDGLGGSHGDNLIFIWDRWWLRKAWEEGHNPYFTPYMFYPNGPLLFFHSMSWLNVLTWIALEPLVGEMGSYNLSILANLVLCGLSASALLRYLGVGKGTAFVGGLIYAYYPHHMSSVMKQPNLASVQWLPLYTLFLIRATRGGKYTTGLLAGLFLALTALSDWHLLTMAGILTTLWLVYSLVRERKTWGWYSLRNLALAGIVLALVTGPLLFPMVRYMIGGSRIEEIMAEQDVLYQADLLAYLVPSRFHPVFEPLLNLNSFYWSHFLHNRNWQAFPGYTVLGLLGYVVIRRSHRSAFWAFLALVLWALALGPYLRVAGHLVRGIPLPYQLVADLPFVRALRAPDRLNAILALPVSVPAAFSVSDLLTKTRQRWNWGGLAVGGTTALLGCLILFEYLVVPFPLAQPRVSPFYESLRSEDGQFALFDVPTGWGASRHYMYYQTVHHRPIVEGHVSRPIGDVYRFFRKVPLLTRVGEYDKEWKLDLPDISRQLSALADANVRYLIVHKDLLRTEDQLMGWLDWITLRPCYEDEQILVYSTRPEYGRDFQWEHDLGAEVGVIQASAVAADVLSDTLSQGSLLEVEIRWGSRAAPERDLLVEMALVLENGETAQQARWPVMDDWATDRWPAGAVAIGHYGFQIDPLIPGGTYSVQVSLLDSESLAPVGKSAAVDAITIHEQPRRFEPPEPATALDVSFEEQLRLLGYDMHVDGQSLALTLHWQALCDACETWKFFVHVIDPSTGMVVAQADVMPRNWTYPTNWWAFGEYVDDTIVVPLEEVPSGTFQVAVGVYHPDSGVRLITSTGADQVVLPEGIIR
jgi:hypothetical protein